jgi:hypothetical protein
MHTAFFPVKFVNSTVRAQGSESAHASLTKSREPCTHGACLPKFSVIIGLDAFGDTPSPKRTSVGVGSICGGADLWNPGGRPTRECYLILYLPLCPCSPLPPPLPPPNIRRTNPRNFFPRISALVIARWRMGPSMPIDQFGLRFIPIFHTS